MKSNEIIYEGNTYDYIIIRGKPRYRINKKLAAETALPSSVIGSFLKGSKSNVVKQTDTMLQDKLPPLTKKQKAFVDYALSHPKESYTEAAAQTYDVESRNTAKSIAAENLTKPAIKMALGQANDIVENTLSNVVREWGKSDDVRERTLAVTTAEYIHDKIHGKAKQVTENTNINIDFMEALRNLK